MSVFPAKFLVFLFLHDTGPRFPSVAAALIVELLGPNFQQKFAFGGRNMKFDVELLLTMLCLNIDRSKTF